MRKYTWSLGLLLLCSTAAAAWGQTNSFCQANASKLYCKIPSLFGDATINPLQAFDQGFATQLTLVPLASPASGIVWMKSPSTKLPVPSGTETFGPVLTERGETLYTRKLFISATYQRFRFTSLDGINLKEIPMLFQFCTTGGQCGPIAAVIRVDAHLDQYAFFATYGITSWLDTSIAIPVARVALSANGVRCVQPYCSFTSPGGVTVSFQNTGVSGSVTGIGDILLRGKASLVKWHKFRLAEGLDVRLPSGDSLNFLGAGSAGIKPFLAVSRGGRFSPHLDLSYQRNGDSYLGGAVAGQKGQLPASFAYALGSDLGLAKVFTLSVDYLGERVTDASRLQEVPSGSVETIRQAQGSFNTSRGALGFKWKPTGELLVSGNVLLKFEHNGLRHKAVPLAGISYTF